jgi:hypothetical protein
MVEGLGSRLEGFGIGVEKLTAAGLELRVEE